MTCIIFIHYQFEVHSINRKHLNMIIASNYCKKYFKHETSVINNIFRMKFTQMSL